MTSHGTTKSVGLDKLLSDLLPRYRKMEKDLEEDHRRLGVQHWQNIHTHIHYIYYHSIQNQSITYKQQESLALASMARDDPHASSTRAARRLQCAVKWDASLLVGPILWGHSGPLCHALSLSLSWTSMRRQWAQHFFKCFLLYIGTGRDMILVMDF